MKFCLRATAGLLAVLLAGCSITHPTPGYVTSTDNFFILRDLKGSQINIGAFTASIPAKEKSCRAASVATPDRGDFSEYVRNAFVRELRGAGIYSPNAPITLTGNLDVLELAAFKGEWNMTLTLKSSNSRSLTVSSKTSFDMVWDGKVACTRAANEFLRATQALVSNAVTAPGFVELIR